MIEAIINIIKEVVLVAYNDRERIQMFDCIGMGPDEKITIFVEDDVRVLWCPYWEYVEVLGLSDEDYQKVFDAVGY